MCLITTVENSEMDVCLHVSSSEVYSYAAEAPRFFLLYSAFEFAYDETLLASSRRNLSSLSLRFVSFF